MRFLLLAISVAAALGLGATRAEARYGWYPWCAWLSVGPQAGSCAYESLSQCWATVRGVGGYCGVNPYPPPAPPPRYRARRRGYYR